MTIKDTKVICDCREIFYFDEISTDKKNPTVCGCGRFFVCEPKEGWLTISEGKTAYHYPINLKVP